VGTGKRWKGGVPVGQKIPEVRSGTVQTVNRCPRMKEGKGEEVKAMPVQEEQTTLILIHDWRNRVELAKEDCHSNGAGREA